MRYEVTEDSTEEIFHNNLKTTLWDLGIQTIRELETENGILASGREELFGAIFGRDSLITSLKLLKVYQKTEDLYFLNLVKKVLVNLAALQGKEVNIESGEEPGKCIHEYRPQNHEHLTQRSVPSWYVYPNNVMKNYDSVDSTPLFLIALYRYFEVSRDQEFLESMLPYVDAALQWIFVYGDSNKDGFIDYELHPDRKSGGLVTQSWMDSHESVFHEEGEEMIYPIAPLEVQAYVHLALRSWSSFYKKRGDEKTADILFNKAKELKELFNKKFVTKNKKEIWLAAGIDGKGRQLRVVRSSMGHCLWAAFQKEDGTYESILKEKYISGVIGRLMKEDLFVPEAGIRTLSSLSSHFSPNSYHNGSIWPHDNSLIVEGFENFGYLEEAGKIRQAILGAISHFKTPLELYVYENGYAEYLSPNGQTACRKQAWSAASLLQETSSL